jgi:histidine triad (HIT) family protein
MEATRHETHDDECVFCKILIRELEADIVFETDEFVVFKDHKPDALVHLLVIPRQHIESVNTLGAADLPLRMCHRD